MDKAKKEKHINVSDIDAEIKKEISEEERQTDQEINKIVQNFLVDTDKDDNARDLNMDDSMEMLDHRFLIEVGVDTTGLIALADCINDT